MRMRSCSACLYLFDHITPVPTQLMQPEQSSTCIPASSLLAPLKHNICPLSSERFELRTRALGCGCSTITLLSILITLVCTLVATLFIYVVWRMEILQWLWRIIGPGAWEGWERVEKADGSITEGAWRRGGKSWGFRLFSGLAIDDETIEERRRLLGGS